MFETDFRAIARSAECMSAELSAGVFIVSVMFSLLMVFENMELRRIFGPRRDEVMGEWWRLHNEELKILYTSSNIAREIKLRRMRWAGHVARMGEKRRVYRVLVGKPEGKSPMERPRCRWVYNIRMDLQEVGCRYTDWIGLAQDRDRWRTLMSAVMNLRLP